jgi:DNA-binding NarL/FixJ family response regulator
MDKKMKLILGSNRELWWEGLSALLQKSPKFDLIATCYDTREIIDKVSKYKPDVLMLDIDFNGDCSEITRQINSKYPDTKIILIIKPYKDIKFSESFKARARAYIDKNITFSELENCILNVNEGSSVIIHSLAAQRLMDADQNNEKAVSGASRSALNLSKREKAILHLMARSGSSNKEMANYYGITENTVKAHLNNIYKKLSVRNRQQAIIKARISRIIAE